MWIPCESKKDKEIVDMTFAENLKMLRKQAGMSQEQLAEKLGVSRQAVTKWETEFPCIVRRDLDFTVSMPS